MIEAILFDFDDTLINYRASEEHGLTKALEQCGVTVKPEYLQLYAEVNQRLWQQAERGELSTAELRVRRFEILIRETGIEPGIPPKRLGELYLHHFAEIVVLEDGAFSILSWLETHPQIKKAIITNGFRDTQRRRIALTQIGGFFDELFISGEMGSKKPEAEIFRQSLERLGIEDPEKVMIVGDNLVSDIMGGKQAGLVTCWYNPRGMQADEFRQYIDHEIDHLSGLTDLPVLKVPPSGE